MACLERDVFWKKNGVELPVDGSIGT